MVCAGGRDLRAEHHQQHDHHAGRHAGPRAGGAGQTHMQCISFSGLLGGLGIISGLSSMLQSGLTTEQPHPLSCLLTTASTIFSDVHIREAMHRPGRRRARWASPTAARRPRTPRRPSLRTWPTRYSPAVGNFSSMRGPCAWYPLLWSALRLQLAAADLLTTRLP